MSDLNNEIIKRIKQIRIEKGLSQERLSELSKLDSKYINKLENGRFNLTIPTLERILSSLEIGKVDFFKSLSNSKVENSTDELLNILNSYKSEKREAVSKNLINLIRVIEEE